MKYATVQDLIDNFGEAELILLTDRSVPPSGSYDAAIAEKRLNDAEAEVDAYLSTRYALPLETIPNILNRLVCDIARYYLFGAALTDEVSKRYNDAIAFLKNVSTGKASLGINENSGDAPVAENLPDYFSSGRVIDKTVLDDYNG